MTPAHGVEYTCKCSGREYVTGALTWRPEEPGCSTLSLCSIVKLITMFIDVYPVEFTNYDPVKFIKFNCK